MTAPDSFLLLSFGGPESHDDVMPFLRRVTAGRGVPDERLAVVADQYKLFGGRSPLNDHNRDLLAAIAAEFERRTIDLPTYWGNRNWHPLLEHTVTQMAEAGSRHALVFATSAFSSYSGCRQYRDDLVRAAAAVGDAAPRLQKLRLFYNHPGFIEPLTDRVREALDRLAERAAGPARLIFTAHSIPLSMAAGSDYEVQLAEAARLVMAGLSDAGANPATYDANDYDLVYQSRSGPPQVPWLEPDVGDHLEQLAASGVQDVVVCPLGFVSDHMEVLYDLDTLAAERAAAAGITLERASTVGTDPRFVAMIVDLVEEQLSGKARLR
ncbi:MAG: ferrochelatase [Acidimicrobiales bacterium]